MEAKETISYRITRGISRSYLRSPNLYNGDGRAWLLRCLLALAWDRLLSAQYIYLLCIILINRFYSSSVYHRYDVFLLMLALNIGVDTVYFLLVVWKKFDVSFRLSQETYRRIGKSVVSRHTKYAKAPSDPKKIEASEIQIGDIVKFDQNDVVPADVLVLSASDEVYGNFVCRVDSSTFDGKSEVQVRQAVSLTKGLNQFIDDDRNAKKYLNRLNARVGYTRGADNSITGSFKMKEDPRVDKITDEMVCQRGSVVRSKVMVGLVLFTGLSCQGKEQAHIMTCCKTSGVERRLRGFTFVLAILSVLLSSVCAVVFDRYYLEGDQVVKVFDKVQVLSFTSLFLSCLPTTVNILVNVYYIITGFIVERKYGIINSNLRRELSLHKFDDMKKWDVKRSFRVINYNCLFDMGDVDDVFFEKAGVFSTGEFDVKSISSRSRLYYTKSSTGEGFKRENATVYMDESDDGESEREDKPDVVAERVPEFNDQSIELPESQKLSIPHFDFKTKKMGRTPFQESCNTEEANLKLEEEEIKTKKGVPGISKSISIKLENESPAPEPTNNIRSSKSITVAHKTIKRKSIMDKLHDESQFNRDVNSKSEIKRLLMLFATCHKSKPLPNDQ